MTTTYQKLLNKIEAFCNAHLQIKKYKGEFKEQMPNFATLDEKYPIVFVVPNGDTEGLELNQFTLEVYCLDIIQKDRANINTIVSDCHLILKDLYLYFKDGTDLEVDVIGDPTMTPLNNDLLDYAAGWVMTITFEVEGYTVCAIPMNPIPPFTPICEDASYLVEYVNGTPIESGTIPSGGSAIIQVPDPSVCDDAIVNINSVFWDNVPSGGTENIIVRQSSGSTQVGSIQGQYFRIADSTAVLKTTSNVTLSTTSIKAEDSEDIVAPDTDIEVNGVAEGSVVAGSTVDIQLSDSLGVVTPTSVTQVGNDFQIVLPDAPPAVTRSTATLMKTGQTTSYRTGDDGDLEAGRDTDFFTLAENNPFGNTNRFTDELGGSTYTNDIVIDWSTYDNVAGTVLGYYLGDASNRTWNDYIDWALALSIGTFTTGWRSINVKEMTNLWQYSTNRATNYSPFNGGFFTLNIATSSRFFWTSTTYPTTTANAIRVDLASWALQSTAKTNSNQCIAVRTFTVTGTTLT
jgi:hypothetical protein